MLSRILEEFKKVDGPLDLNELSRRMDVERSALDGVIQLLVRQGKLCEVGPGTNTCANCAGHLSCAQADGSKMMGKWYELVY